MRTFLHAVEAEPLAAAAVVRRQSDAVVPDVEMQAVRVATQFDLHRFCAGVFSDIGDGFLEDSKRRGLHHCGQPLVAEIFVERHRPARLGGDLVDALAGREAKTARGDDRGPERAQNPTRFDDRPAETVGAGGELRLRAGWLDQPEILARIDVLLGASVWAWPSFSRHALTTIHAASRMIATWSECSTMASGAGARRGASSTHISTAS